MPYIKKKYNFPEKIDIEKLTAKNEKEDNAEPVQRYEKNGRQIARERAIAISNTVNEITEAVKDARSKGDYKTVADLTNTLVALLTVTKGE